MNEQTAHKKIIVNLKPHLERSGMSLRALARASGTYHSVLAKWLNNPEIESVNLRVLANVVTVLGLTHIDELLIIVDNENPDE